MNSLDLHLNGEVVLPYNLYQGKVQELLLKLRSAHLSPLGAAHFSRRLEEVTESPEVFQEWSNLCPVLGDGIAIHPYGSVRIFRGNEKLWNDLAVSTLREGVVELAGNSYSALEGHYIIGMKRLNKEKFKQEIFSYFDLSAEGRDFFFPIKDFPYLTLLAFNNGTKILGASRLDDQANLIGIR